MTGNKDCPHNKNIDCPCFGAILFCQHCGFYPLENERRKHHLNKHIVEIETERQKNIIQLFIKHNKKRVSYTIRRVRKRTASPKTNSQLNNQQGDG